MLPIIMLTAKGEDADIVVGLELGADATLSNHSVSGLQAVKAVLGEDMTRRRRVIGYMISVYIRLVEILLKGIPLF
jgi:CheY-like chemotaxis protein